MTRRDIYQALLGGRSLQAEDALGSWPDRTETDICVYLTSGRQDYAHIRLKPATQRVPLGPEDVKPGSVIDGSNDAGSGENWLAVLRVDFAGVYAVNNCNEIKIHTFDSLLRYFKISRDGGKTWAPCWKEKP